MIQALVLTGGMATAATASVVPDIPQGRVHLLAFTHDAQNDVSVATADVWVMNRNGWDTEYHTIRAADGRAFTIRAADRPAFTSLGDPRQGGVSVFTETSGYMTRPQETTEPAMFYLQARLGGSVALHYAFGTTGSQSFFLPGLYDEIRFGWHFPMGLDPALSARPGWYDRPRDLTRFLAPGQIGCYYFTCQVGGWIGFQALDPANGARPAAAGPAAGPPPQVPLPGAASALLGGVAALVGLRRRLRQRRAA